MGQQDSLSKSLNIRYAFNDPCQTDDTDDAVVHLGFQQTSTEVCSNALCTETTQPQPHDYWQSTLFEIECKIV